MILNLFSRRHPRQPVVQPALRRLWNLWPFDRRDACLLIGLGALTYGIGNIYRPAGWIAIGIVLLLVWAQPYFVRRKQP